MHALKRAAAEFIGCLNGPRTGHVGTTTRTATALAHVVRQHRRRSRWKRFETMPLDAAEALLARHVAASEREMPADLFAATTGTIWVTPHFGDFVSGIAILARLHRNAGRSLSVMLSGTYAAADRHYGALATALGVAFVSANLLTAARRLKAGNGVVILADAVYPLPSMRYVPFLGTMIATLGLAPRLAAMTGSALRPFHCDGVGLHRTIRVAAPVTIPATGAKATDAYLGSTLIARWMEQVIARDPASWHHWDRVHRQVIPVTDRPDLLDAYLEWLAAHPSGDLVA